VPVRCESQDISTRTTRIPTGTSELQEVSTYRISVYRFACGNVGVCVPFRWSDPRTRVYRFAVENWLFSQGVGGKL